MKRDFTLTEVLMVLTIIAMLMTIGIPALLRARARAQTQACIVNLRKIEDAKQQWATERRICVTNVPTPDDLQPYLGRGASGQLPICPADPKASFASSYSIHNLKTPPACQIDATNHLF